MDCNYVSRNIISGQDPDNLQYVDPPTKIRSFLFKKITSIFKEEKPSQQKNFKFKDYNNTNNNTIEGLPSQENVKWFNEICRIKPVINV